MSVRPRDLVLRLTLFVGGTALLALGLTACADSPSTPTSVSAIVGETAMSGKDMPETSQSSYIVEVVFESAVVAGDNPLAVQVHDAVTGEPLRNAVVRVAVTERAQAETATDNHSSAETAGHDGGAEADGHDGAETMGHEGAEADGHDGAETMGHGEAEAGGHDGAETMGHGEAEADDHDGAETMGHGDGGADGHDSPETVGHGDAGEDDHGGEESVGHGHAAPAVATLVAGSAPGEHIGQVTFPDVGEWNLSVHIVAAGEEREAVVAVTAGRDQGRMIVLGGFLSLNIAIIATAAITKRRAVRG